MKTNLKNLFIKINSNCPFIGSLIRIFFPRKSFATNKHLVEGVNNRIRYDDATLSYVTFDIVGNNNKIEIKEDCILKNVTFMIRGSGHRVLINSGCRFKQGGSIWFEDSNGLLTIGENTTFENVHMAITEPNSKITIGQDCLFSYDIDLRTGDSHSIISQENNQRLNYAEDISIGNHVWVAAHSILLKGSAVADNSVVATGSIVSQKSNKEGIIIGGNPAKEIKDGITWSKKRNNRTR
jgi:acetyltransferase-like isoleucine patch superfamily enzyme